jgi:hypothetical protein
VPFLGARTRSGKYQINAKVYGPNNTFSSDTNRILTSTLVQVADEEMDMPDTAKSVASRLAKLLSFDPNVAWVECEVLHESGLSFGDVALAEDN